MADAALAYHEPGIITILIQSSFLLVLNILGCFLDHVFYCGLVGQVLIGMAWGTPAARILPGPFEETATQLGYLGLIMIVFEGGLATSAGSLGRSLTLSICVALTGIGIPIALSFSLMGISNATRLQAFAAGAALCSTSLGTTFSLLKATSLTTSRLGTVLTSAAMLDDVVGLVLVQVISNLGSDHASISATTVVRPLFVSLAFAIVLPVACYLLKPVIIRCCHTASKTSKKFPGKRLGFSLPLPFLLSTAFLLALCTAASYAGTSNLFAAYLAGAIISWVDEVSSLSVIPNPKSIARHLPREQEIATGAIPGIAGGDSSPTQIPGKAPRCPAPSPSPSVPPGELTPALDDLATAEVTEHAKECKTLTAKIEIESRATKMYNSYYAPAVDRLLKPFFFASIGFSIPISKMFEGAVIWRGVVYAILMAIGKLCCGLWLVRFKIPVSNPQAATEAKKQPHKITLPRPKSLYPAAIVGCAMVARGEIGFLIAALAATNGIFASQDPPTPDGADTNLTSELYLIVTWAILLCTIGGPLALGYLAKRVKRLQEQRARDSGHGAKEDPLGIWGVK